VRRIWHISLEMLGIVILTVHWKLKLNSVAFSPQVNCTYWATATGQQILVPTFADRGVSCGHHGGSRTAVNLCFIDRNRYFFIQVVLHLSSRDRVDAIPDPLLLRNVGIPGNRTQGPWICSQELWPLGQRGGDSLLKIEKSTDPLKSSVRQLLGLSLWSVEYQIFAIC
jgi:hypothetical protein